MEQMIVSDKFMVNSDAGRMAAARYATENFAWQAKLDKRDTLRLDLLVEETLGMVKTMLEDFYGQIWFTADGRDLRDPLRGHRGHERGQEGGAALRVQHGQERRREGASWRSWAR